MTAGEVQQEVQKILRSELRIAVPTPDTDLLDSGLLDSLGLVDLIAAIERQFDITIDLMELDLDDIRSVQSISGLIEARLS